MSGATDSKASDVSRADFEAALRADGFDSDHYFRRDATLPDDYDDVYIHCRWEGWQLARASQQPSAQWIACSERMPEADQQVWVWLRFSNGSEDQGYAIWTGIDWFLDVSESGSLIARQTAIQEGLDAADVTHWQPLPHSPDTAPNGEREWYPNHESDGHETGE